MMTISVLEERVSSNFKKISDRKGGNTMLEDYVIYGLQDLINNKTVQMENGVEVLNNAIKLIKENKYSLDRLGCPCCFEKEDLVCLGKVGGYKYYECQNCKTKIKVKVFYEIIGFKTK